MFTYQDNKYSKTYFQLVAKAQARPIPHRHWRKRPLNDDYYEMHHIWPTSLGGPDTEDNHVYFTGHEHFVAHLLLTKMLTDTDRASMLFALNRMLKIPKKMQGLRYVPTGRTYEIARKAAADAVRGNKEIAAKISASHKGKKLTEEHKRKISEGGKGRQVSDEHKKIISDRHKGKPKSPEAKEKMKLAWIARRERIAAGLEPRKPMSEQARKNISNGKLGKKIMNRKPMSEQAVENIKAAAATRKGKPLSAEHRAKISQGLSKI